MIELLPTTGCTGEELISKINEIIAVVNAMSNTTSYNDLTDKPSINGVTLVSDKTTAQMQISMAGLSDYETQMSAIATKTEVHDAQSAATAAATAAVQEQIAGKLDKDVSSTRETDMLSKKAFVYISDGNQTKKVSLDTLTKNVGYTLTESKIVQGGSGKPLTASVWVKASEWLETEQGYIQTVNMPGMTKEAIVQASPAPEQMEAWSETPCYLAETEDDSLVFIAENEPSEDFIFNLLYWKQW